MKAKKWQYYDALTQESLRGFLNILAEEEVDPANIKISGQTVYYFHTSVIEIK